MEHTISFPGIGIDEFTIHSTAFEFKNFSVAWYGIIITAGIILAVLCIYLQLKKRRLIFDDLIDITLCTVLPGIVGARLYYVFFDWLVNPDHYTSFIDIIAIWNGGLAIYGGLIFGAIGCIFALRWKKVHIPAFFDTLAPAVQLAQAIGRWGNFMNAEAYGSETAVKWRMRIVDAYNPTGIEVHPTFLYESVWNLIGFILAMLYSKKKKFDGEVCLLYLAWYGLGRMFIEGMRADSLYIGSTGIRVSQLLAAICLIVSVALLIYLRFIKRYRYRSDCVYLETSVTYQRIMSASAVTVQAEQVAAPENETAAQEPKAPCEQSEQPSDSALPDPDSAPDSKEDN